LRRRAANAITRLHSPTSVMPRFLTILICSMLLLAPAHAAESAAPYDRDLQRLSEILGALHYLRGICGANEGALWRDQMQALVEAETQAGERRDRMIVNFNRGYRGFQQSYRTCTPAAQVAIRRYLDEGAKLARDITSRYAN
jgi:uncharacterized protein (TIGR02301 family)